MALAAQEKTFTQKMLEYPQSIFNPSPPAFVVLIYETWQNSYDVMLEHKYRNLSITGILDIEYLKQIFTENKSNGGTLLIIYDQMQYIDQHIVSSFTIYSHHYSVTCLLLTNFYSFRINYTELLA